jgi:poly-gamma-glutamate synthesis protein (capsule biosynthesis protein)
MNLNGGTQMKKPVRYKYKRRKGALGRLIVVLTAILVICGLVIHFGGLRNSAADNHPGTADASGAQNDATASPIATQTPAATAAAADGDTIVPTDGEASDGSTVINISAIGDVALGQDSRIGYEDSFEDVLQKIGSNQDYFFSNVADIFLKDDLTIANLETTLSKETKKAEKFDVPSNNWWFEGDPANAAILKAGGIDVVDLANNHTYDYTETGYGDTREAVKEAGISYFGYSDIAYEKVKGITIALLGFNQLGNVEQGTDLEELKAMVQEMITQAREKSQMVIVYFHWGKEYCYTVTESQKELGRFSIDNGADLVLGAHPHVLEPIEKYEGKYIVYSLGNFCFGGNKKPPDFDTAIYQQAYTFGRDKTLVSISDPDITPCSISSSPEINDYKPVIAGDQQKTRVLQKLGRYNMVDLESYVGNLAINLKYATADNIARKPLYKSNIAWLREGTTDKLKEASRLLAEKGYQIEVWDAYRPAAIQQKLYDAAPVKSVYADPQKGSNHTRGAAVDITLVKDGKEIDMPSGFDDPTDKASREYSHATPEQKQNALLLQSVMEQCGFKPLGTEWWHFDDSDYKDYDFIDFDPDSAGR